MKKILPPILHPPDAPLTRRHAPKASGEKGYQRFAPCLSWEFGFVCPFCLLHEVDHVPRGARGTGVFSAEHRILQKDNQAEQNNYSNCIYCCRFCNRDRWTATLTDTQGRQLLDPTTTKWSAHFRVENDEVLPQQDDENAHYTCESYKPNQPRKLDARRVRREKVSGALAELRSHPSVVKRLNAIAARVDGADKTEILDHIERLRATRKKLINDLREEWPLVPKYAPKTCVCDAVDKLAVPDVYGQQASLV